MAVSVIGLEYRHCLQTKLEQKEKSSDGQVLP